MEEPARAVIMMAVSTGPSSLMRAEGNDRTEQAFRAKFHKGIVKLQAQDHSGKQSDEHHDVR